MSIAQIVNSGIDSLKVYVMLLKTDETSEYKKILLMVQP